MGQDLEESWTIGAVCGSASARAALRFGLSPPAPALEQPDWLSQIHSEKGTEILWLVGTYRVANPQGEQFVSSGPDLGLPLTVQPPTVEEGSQVLQDVSCLLWDLQCFSIMACIS